MGAKRRYWKLTPTTRCRDARTETATAGARVTFHAGGGRVPSRHANNLLSAEWTPAASTPACS
ncbi:hypothetical protein SBV1_3080006 [Verrucomicrobia bacterium]|nr:hypothetical protein SBV1_3080006 [Verrucomicrobiota bacterium]